VKILLGDFNAGENCNIKTTTRSFENAARLKYFGRKQQIKT
jgi:hypothetical protein